MSSILFKPQPTEIEGYAHGQQDVLLRFAAGSIPSGLTVRVYSGLGQTLMPGFAPALVAAGLTDAIFLRWTQIQKQAMSAYSSLWIELIWDGVCQLAGPLRMNLSPAAGPEVGLVTARTRTSGDVFVYADQLVSLALSIQADVTGKLGQINAVKQHVDQKSDHVDEQADHVDEQTDHVDQQKTLIDQAKQHIDGQANHVDDQTDHVDQQKTLIDQAKEHIDGQVTHVDVQTDHVDQQKTLIDQAKQHIDGQATHVDEQTGHVDQQKTLIDQAKEHIDGQATHVDEQTDHVDQQKTLIDQAKQHIDGQVTHVDDQTDHVDAQKTLIDQQKALIDQAAQQVAQNAQTATDQAGIAVANRFVFKGSYQNNTVYAAGDGVMYANSFIRRKTAGSSGSTFVPGDWDFLAMGINLRGTYQNNTYYALNDLVIFRRSAYLAPANLTTGATFNRASWVRIAAGWNPAGAWTAAAAVYEDDILTNQGSTYRVTTDHTTPASFSTANLELIAAKGDPGTLTASAFPVVSLPLSGTDKIVIQRGDGSMGKIDPFTTGFPDSRPSVLFDFAGSGVVSPRLVYSRSGQATRFNRAGNLETVGANVPRINHDPATGKCLGYLSEETRANLITQSAGFDSSAWVRMGCTTSAGPVLTLDNALVTKVIPGAAFAGVGLMQNITLSNQNAVLSVFAKAGEYNGLQLNMNGSGAAARAFFNLVTGTVAFATAGTSGIIPLKDGWYLCWVATAAAVTGTTTCQIMPWDSVIATPNGTGGVYMSDPLAEVGTFVTSRIKTLATSLTRGADLLYLPVSSSWFNKMEGTLFVEVYTRGISSAVQQFALSLVGPAWGIGIRQTSATTMFGQFRDQGLGGDAGTFTIVPNTVQRFAITYKDGQPIKFYGASGVNTGAANYSAALGALYTRLCIGCYNDSNVFNNHVLKAAYWPVQLTQSQAQTLVL
ncbi:phage head spike fiber domain-containing protein [Arsenicibacter rosenii]|uniref:Uncharacterized protein n=1 Tax=Arsenicibacter rosenii TaxID=1750698 RepID=A0A1S2VFZ8_9BACT|nr:hypothetical protein [Arsenicibacter rosenii]OIN57629.1 hypothetical protein BLX24_19325 [Arsenicibacter rosenii]